LVDLFIGLFIGLLTYSNLYNVLRFTRSQCLALVVSKVRNNIRKSQSLSLTIMRHSLALLALVHCFAQAQTAWKVGQEVSTSSGKMVGHPSVWKNQVSEYLGVPFAQPPVGDLRWAAPKAIKDGSKTINATKYVRLFEN
jgi:Carboxylesterase family